MSCTQSETGRLRSLSGDRGRNRRGHAGGAAKATALLQKEENTAANIVDDYVAQEEAKRSTPACIKYGSSVRLLATVSLAACCGTMGYHDLAFLMGTCQFVMSCTHWNLNGVSEAMSLIVSILAIQTPTWVVHAGAAGFWMVGMEEDMWSIVVAISQKAFIVVLPVSWFLGFVWWNTVATERSYRTYLGLDPSIDSIIPGPGQLWGKIFHGTLSNAEVPVEANYEALVETEAANEEVTQEDEALETGGANSEGAQEEQPTEANEEAVVETAGTNEEAAQEEQEEQPAAASQGSAQRGDAGGAAGRRNRCLAWCRH